MTYKLSHYLVVTEPVTETGKRVIFATRTGKSLIVPQICWDFLEAGKFDDIPQPVLDKLIGIKAVVPASEEELQAVIHENKQAIDSESSETLYEVIQPSAMCQLGCYYCGQQHTKDYLTTNLYDKMLARIRQKLDTGSYTQLFIGWFGAEPLMGLKQMRELTSLFKELAREYNISYAAKMVSNGLSLKENIFEELVRDLAVTHIEVTLDGTADHHDTHRYTKEKGRSFDLIFNNLLSIFNRPDFKQMGCGISIRCNVDENNFEGVTPLIHLLAKHELQHKMTYFYPIGIYAWGNEAHKKSLTKEEFARKEIEWLTEMIKLDFPVRLTPGRVKKTCLSVSKTSEMYDAFGNIFNCTEVSYVPQYEGTDYVIGNLKNDPSTFGKRNKLTDWNDTLLTDQFPCHTCKMLPVCGGGCPKSWHEDMRACPPNKFNIQDKLMLAHLLAKTDKEQIHEKLDEFRTMHVPAY